MNAYATASDTLVVRVGTETKLELAERARENDRSPVRRDETRAARVPRAERRRTTTRERERYRAESASELKPDTSRAGVVDDGNIAWPERLVDARRQCMDVPAEGLRACWPAALARPWERDRVLRIRRGQPALCRATVLRDGQSPRSHDDRLELVCDRGPSSSPLMFEIR